MSPHTTASGRPANSLIEADEIIPGRDMNQAHTVISVRGITAETPLFSGKKVSRFS